MDFKKYPMAEPYKIKMVEPLKVTTREYRESNERSRLQYIPAQK